MKKVKLLSLVPALALIVTLLLTSCGNTSNTDDFSHIPDSLGCKYPTTISTRETAMEQLSELSVNSKKQLFDEYADSRYTTFVFRNQAELEQYAQSYAALREGQMEDHIANANTSYDHFYNEFMDRYSAVDFDEALLILAAIPSPSTSRNYSVSHVDVSGDKFVIHVAEHRPGADALETAMASQLTLEMIVPLEDVKNVKKFDTVKSYITNGLFYATSDSMNYTSLILLDGGKYVLQGPDGRICGYYEDSSERLTLYHTEENKKYVFEHTTSNDRLNLPVLRLTDEGDSMDDFVYHGFVYYDTPPAEATGQPLALLDTPNIPQSFGAPYPTSFYTNNDGGQWSPLVGDSTAVPMQPDSLQTYVVRDRDQLSRALMEEAEDRYERLNDPSYDKDTYIQQQYAKLMLEFGKYDFDKYSFIFCGGGTPDMGYKYSVSHIATSDGGFTVYITEHDPGSHAFVTASWRMAMMVPSEVLDNATYVNTRLTDYSYVAYTEKTDNAYPAYILLFKDYTFLMYTGGEDGQRIRGSYRYDYDPRRIVLTDGNTGNVCQFSTDLENMELIESSFKQDLPEDIEFVFSCTLPEPYLDQESIMEPM